MKKIKTYANSFHTFRVCLIVHKKKKRKKCKKNAKPKIYYVHVPV